MTRKRPRALTFYRFVGIPRRRRLSSYKDQPLVITLRVKGWTLMSETLITLSIYRVE